MQLTALASSTRAGPSSGCCATQGRQTQRRFAELPALELRQRLLILRHGLGPTRPVGRPSSYSVTGAAILTTWIWHNRRRRNNASSFSAVALVIKRRHLRCFVAPCTRLARLTVLPSGPYLNLCVRAGVAHPRARVDADAEGRRLANLLCQPH